MHMLNYYLVAFIKLQSRNIGLATRECCANDPEFRMIVLANSSLCSNLESNQFEGTFPLALTQIQALEELYVKYFEWLLR
jgi:hypothetical protein